MKEKIFAAVLGCGCAMVLSLFHPLWLIAAVVFLLFLGKTALTALMDSEIDPLTQLWNLRHLEQMRRCYRRRDHIAVIYLDMDDLKQINDTWGHAAGSTALRKVAHTLLDADDDAYRIGGDEFLLISKDMDAAELLSCWQGASESLDVSISWGIAEGAGSALDDLIARAEENMYQNK